MDNRKTFDDERGVSYNYTMARPKKGEEKNRTCRMAFRASEAVRDAVDAAASAEGKSISDVLNDLIERELIHAHRKAKK